MPVHDFIPSLLPAIINLDNVAPTVAITLSQYAFKIGDTATVTFTFSEEVLNFTVADVSAQSGSLSGFTSTANPLVYTATFTPAVTTTDATNIITVGTNWTDLKGNPPSGSTNSSNYTVDTVRPTVAITLDDYSLDGGQSTAVTFTFSKEPTGFTSGDVTSPNGTLSSFGVTGNPLIYTATFTADNVTDSTNVITVGTGWTDLAGNAPAGSTDSSNYTITALYSISGTVFDADGTTAVQSATVALGAYNTTSAANGTYTISGIPAGTSGSLTCTKSGYSWTAISVSAMAGNLTNQNYTANWNLISNLVAYWKLDEATGASRADSVGSATLSDNGTVTGAAGKISNGAKFGGGTTGPYLSTSAASMKFGDSTFMLTFWIYITTANFSGFPLVFGADHDDVATNQNYGMYLQASNTTMHWFVYNSAGAQKDVSISLTGLLDAWNFVCVYHDAAADQIGISLNNGAFTTLAMGGAARAAGVEDFWLGGAQLTATPRFILNSMMDEFGAYGRKLAAADITALYNGGSGRTYPF